MNEEKSPQTENSFSIVHCQAVRTYRMDSYKQYLDIVCVQSL